MNVHHMILLLRARYAEPWRRYHDWKHVERMLKEFKPVRHLAREARAVEWTIRFHDAVYEPTARNNEERSAQLATAFLDPFMPSAVVDEIARLILLTKRHEPCDDDTDGQILCGCDLAVLGWPWDDFLEFGQQIRAECDFVDDRTFCAQRLRFMRAFLARTHIVGLEHFRRKYEARARDNLQRAVALLS